MIFVPRKPSAIRKSFHALSSFHGLLACAALLVSLACSISPAFADEPYARSRDYDLQHSKIVLRFDTAQKQVIGDVTHTLAILRDNTAKVSFDSVGLTIHSVTVDRAPAKFETTDTKLIVALPESAKTGQKFEIEIKYDGKPSKGLYFILPDAGYPDRPRQIWTQGEAEDTRFYLPTYDYPNDRLTTDTYLTVPANWETISNGRLASKPPAADGQIVWHWIQEAPLSTYLITVVAGEFDRADDTWRAIPLA